MVGPKSGGLFGQSDNFVGYAIKVTCFTKSDHIIWVFSLDILVEVMHFAKSSCIVWLK